MNTTHNHNTDNTHNAGFPPAAPQAPTASREPLTVLQHIGRPSTIPDWPTNDLDGLFDALSRWTLDSRMSGMNAQEMALRDPDDDKIAPFRSRAWCGCVLRYDGPNGQGRYYATVPVYPAHPDAVAYSGNFLEYSFGFSVHTDDPELIDRLDAAIAANMQGPEYLAAVARENARKGR